MQYYSLEFLILAPQSPLLPSNPPLALMCVNRICSFCQFMVALMTRIDNPAPDRAERAPRLVTAGGTATGWPAHRHARAVMTD
jgi:hypothetical protein